MKSFMLIIFTSFCGALIVVFFLVLYGDDIMPLPSRAYNSLLSRQNSFVFAVPACGRAGDNGEAVRLNVIVLNEAGLGAGNTECRVVADYSQQLTVKPIQSITDSYGKALFDVSGDISGVHEVKVICDDQVINEHQKICLE